MKKLIERMRVSYKEKLLEESVKYPFSIGPALEELKNKSIWFELSYETIGILVSHLKLGGYEPYYISEVFDNK